MINLIKAFLAPKIDPEKTITEIHESFDTASEKILKEAKTIIANTETKNFKKSERLRKLGFYGSKIVTETAIAAAAKESSERLAGQIMYYQLHYPNNKFITENMVEVICTKYNLVCGDTRYYKGDVPEKNILEMEKFSLRQEDKGLYPPIEGRQDNGTQSYEGPFGEKYLPFKICASLKDFDMRGMEVAGYKIQVHIPKVRIPDPVVLQQVEGGYLIVSKWGLEGDDKTLVNEKLN